MTASPLNEPRNDDPLRLRELLQRAIGLADRHETTSVVVGMAAGIGDLLFPEVVDYLESCLRVDDAIFRMTRERAVLFLTDVKPEEAEGIVRRNLLGFRERFATASEPSVKLGFYALGPEVAEAAVKDVLPALFGAAPEAH